MPLYGLKLADQVADEVYNVGAEIAEGTRTTFFPFQSPGHGALRVLISRVEILRPVGEEASKRSRRNDLPRTLDGRREAVLKDHTDRRAASLSAICNSSRLFHAVCKRLFAVDRLAFFKRRYHNIRMEVVRKRNVENVNIVGVGQCENAVFRIRKAGFQLRATRGLAARGRHSGQHRLGNGVRIDDRQTAVTEGVYAANPAVSGHSDPHA